MKLGLGLSIPGVVTMGRAERHLLLPGGVGNYVSSPDSAVLDITGEITLVADVALDDWTPAAFQYLVAKYQANGTRSYAMLVTGATGNVRLTLSENGSDVSTAISSVGTNLTDGARRQVTATWRPSDGRTQFFLGQNQATPSQIGTNQTIALASISANAAILEIGSIGAGTITSAGKIFRARVISGDPNGTVVADCYPDRDYVSGSTFVSSTTGETYTLHGTVTVAS